MDINFIADSIPIFIKAGGVTLAVGLWAIAFSLVIGIVCSVAIHFKIPLAGVIAKAYVELSRNTPSLIQLFFLYYGLPKIGITLSAQTCAIAALSFLGGSYMTEAFRSGIETVGRSQIESAQSIALSPVQIFCHVVLPQSLVTALPFLGANAIFLLKETSIVSAVALEDLTFTAKDIIGTVYKSNESLFLLVVSYLIILLPAIIALGIAEKKVRAIGLGR